MIHDVKRNTSSSNFIIYLCSMELIIIKKFIALSLLEYWIACPSRNVIYNFTKPSFDCLCMIKFHSPFSFQILNIYVYTYRETQEGCAITTILRFPSFENCEKFEISFLSNESWWIEEDISFMCIVMFINWCREKEKVC